MSRRGKRILYTVIVAATAALVMILVFALAPTIFKNNENRTINQINTVTSTHTAAPGVPTGLTLTAADSHISLSWTASLSNGSSAIVGYNIYRDTTSGGKATSPLASVGPSITTYDDTGLTNGRQYFYTVSAVNSINEGSHSIEASATPTTSNVDKYGVLKLNPTKVTGREWFSSWDNGDSRTLKSGKRDLDDPMFIMRGQNDTKLMIDGNGVANMSGTQPRMYVYDSQKILKWRNVEVTIYGKRISEFSQDKSAGINIGARSNHQDQGNSSNCNVDTYYSRMLYSGVANFMKELNHPDEATSSLVGHLINWGDKAKAMPYDQWIGHKFVLRDYDNGTHVKLEMYLDLTNGLNGGDWKLVTEWKDDGNWSVPPNPCNIPVTKIILEDNPSVFIRNTDISSAQYKYFSVREIAPLP
jgi:hypothetical protein